MPPRKIHGDEIYSTKFALSKQKWLHKSPSQFWHFCRMCNPFFPQEAKTMQLEKEKEGDKLTHTKT
jgi:hypothetical protein